MASPRHVRDVSVNGGSASPVMKALLAFCHSSIGRKWVVAVTGIVLILFLVGHLLGNLQVFWGPAQINGYAEKLHHLGVLLWVIRLGLLTFFVAHVWTTIALARANRAARPAKYAYYNTVQASKASRTMAISGLIVFSFVMFHLLHFSVGWIDGKNTHLVEHFQDPRLGADRTDVYRMLVAGFNHWSISFFYILGMGLLCLHLTHGFSSMFQTMGLRNNRVAPLLRYAALGLGVAVFLGFSSMPLAVMTGVLNDNTWPFGRDRQPAQAAALSAPAQVTPAYADRH